MSETHSDLEVIFENYLSTLKTKIAKYQAKKTLCKKVNYKGEGLDVKHLVFHLVNLRGHHVFIKRGKGDGKDEYYIGTASTRILDLNKTSYLFAKYLIENGYCSKNSYLLDYDKFYNKKSIKSEDAWLTHLNQLNLSDILLSEENFGKYSSLIEYIEGIKTKPKQFNTIYAVYDKNEKKLDVFIEEDFNAFSDNDPNVVKLNNVTAMLLRLFRGRDIWKADRDDILGEIDSEFLFEVNRIAEQL